VIVPSWSPTRGAPGPALADALRAAHARGARLLSFCSGAFALAGVGLLDGKRATTHWGHAAEFAARHPEVEFDPAVLYVHDGDVLTSAGSAAGIDLALYVVRLDYGAEIANLVARDLVVPPQRDGGQAQYISAPMATCPDSDPLGETLDWALEHLDEPLTLARLAAHATMSSRTFSRRFLAATGTTPHRWLLHQRVAAAQRLLETTDLSIETIAERSGFGSAASLRARFQQTVRSSPQAYRRTFACS
ncbi:MAG: helix-turn-helix domain-containing protein, partial [Candidatus Nanopelagicales bacterium]